MNDFIHIFTNRNARWRFTNSIFFKLGAGCLGLLFVLVCVGTLVVLYLLPTH